MSTQIRLVASIVLALSVALPCAATQLSWVGTLGFEFLASRPIAIIGTGVASVNASGGGVHLAELRLAGGITGTTALPLTDPDTATLISLRIAASLGTGTLAPFTPSSQSRQLTRRTLPVAGTARLCTLLPGCPSSLLFPLTMNDGQMSTCPHGL